MDEAQNDRDVESHAKAEASSSDLSLLPSPPILSMSSSMVVPVAIAVLSFVVMRLGILAMLCVFALSFVFLCHPVVREYLELAFPGDHSAANQARHEHETAQVLRGRAHDIVSLRENQVNSSPAKSKEGIRMSIDSLPATLQPEMRHILRLVRRDFVQSWFDPISFGSASFPTEAISSMEHVLAQISLRLEQYDRVTVATELSLTALSVIVTAMQNMRSEDAPAPGLWDNASARIESLRTSMYTLLSQSLPEEERRSSMVVELLSEVLSKQLWSALQTYSDPDVINGYILQYGKRTSSSMHVSREEEPVFVHGADSSSSGVTSKDPSSASPLLSGEPLKPNHAPEAPIKNLDTHPDSALTQLDPKTTSPSELRSSPLPARARTPPKASTKSSGVQDLLIDLESEHASQESSNCGQSLPSSTLPDPLEDVLSELRESRSEQDLDGHAPGHGHRSSDHVIPNETPASCDDSISNRSLLSKSSPGPDRSPRPAHSLSNNSPSYPNKTLLQTESRDVSDMPEHSTSLPPSPSDTHVALPSSAAKRNERSREKGPVDFLSSPWAAPMNVPSQVSEPPLPPSIEDSRVMKESYQVRYPKKVQEVLSRKDSDVYDAWGSYLAAIDPTAEPSEGAVLIQLHANLEALDAAATHESSSPALYTSDVRAILQTSLPMLPKQNATSELRSAMESILQHDMIEPPMLVPLRNALLRRMQALYDMFLASVRGKPQQSSEPSSSSTASCADSNTYEPRRKRTQATMSSINVPRNISVVDLSANAEPEHVVDSRTMQVLVTVEEESDDGSGGYAVIRTWPQFEALHVDLVRMYERRPVGSGMSSPPALPSIKGLTSSVACDAIRRYLLELLAPSQAQDGMAWYSSTQAVHRFLDKTRATDEESRIWNNLFMPGFGGMGRTFATGFAGAAGSARRGIGQLAPTPSRAGRIFGLRPDMTETRPAEAPAPNTEKLGVDKGYGLAFVPRKKKNDTERVDEIPNGHAAGRGDDVPLKHDLVSKNHADSVSDSYENKPYVETEPHPSCPASDSKATSAAPSLSLSKKTHVPYETRKRGPKAEGETVSNASSSKTSPATKSSEPCPEETPSLHDINVLLTAVFAVTREALNMHKAWTLQRGMLRIIEQYIRTTYVSTVSKTLSYFASKLSLNEQASWLKYLRESWWPNDVWNTETSPIQTEEGIRTRYQEARKVVLSYAPPQAAYALGIGGKQAVCDALTTVHKVVTDPMVSLDLHLALLLRVIDLAIGTASAPASGKNRARSNRSAAAAHS